MTRSPDFAVFALEYARCPNGHNTVWLTHGRDRRGRYLQAWCTTPGCNAKQIVRRSDLAA